MLDCFVHVLVTCLQLTDFGMSYFSQSDVPRIYPGGTKRNGAYEVNRYAHTNTHTYTLTRAHAQDMQPLCCGLWAHIHSVSQGRAVLLACRLSVPQPEGMSPLAGHYDNRADMCAYGILIQWALTGEHSVRTSLATHCVSEVRTMPCTAWVSCFM